MSSGEKAIVEFIATGGNTPQLQKNKFKLNKEYEFQKVIAFLRKQLIKSAQFDRSNCVYLFVNSTFQPHPEERVGDLFDCFSSGDILVVNYSTATVFG